MKKCIFPSGRFGKQAGAGRDVWLWLKPSQPYLSVTG